MGRLCCHCWGDIGCLIPGLIGAAMPAILIPGDIGALAPSGLGTPEPEYNPGDCKGCCWVGVVQRWLVGVLRPATTPGLTIFSNCCKLDAGPPTTGEGDCDVGGNDDAGDDTGVVIPTLEFGL